MHRARALAHVVAAGDSLFSPWVTSRVIERMTTHQPSPDATRDARLAALTRREREVLELVKTHTKRILAKPSLGA